MMNKPNYYYFYKMDCPKNYHHKFHVNWKDTFISRNYSLTKIVCPYCYEYDIDYWDDCPTSKRIVNVELIGEEKTENLPKISYHHRPTSKDLYKEIWPKFYNVKFMDNENYIFVRPPDDESVFKISHKKIGVKSPYEIGWDYYEYGKN